MIFHYVVNIEDCFLISGWRKSFLWGHWYPCFQHLVMSALIFKARVDSLSCMLLTMHKGFLTFTSGATPTDLLMANIPSETFHQHTCILTLGLKPRINQVCCCFSACNKTDELHWHRIYWKCYAERRVPIMHAMLKNWMHGQTELSHTAFT